MSNMHPGNAELESIAPGVMADMTQVVTALFKGLKFCHPVRYNLQRVTISERFKSGIAKSGVMEWVIDIQPIEGFYTLSAYIDIGWDNDVIKCPALFRDHRGVSCGFSEAAIKGFLYAGADLTDYIPPVMPI